MASLEFAGDSGSLTNIDSTQGEFRDQLAALTDMVKQVVGDAAVSPGDTAQADPLNAPFTLYVNPYTGSDDFVGGSYNDYETGSGADLLASKLKRLEKQRLTCGFSPQRPFKTINRAAIEAAIITSKNWYTDYTDAGQVDCVSIVLSPGVHTVYNDPGSSSTSLTSWGASKTPTISELIEFNPATVGGVLLPRGCSLCGSDLRKITLRPSYVPPAADETSNYSNRLGLLKITGTGYFFGFTIMDKTGLAASHHLLDGFHFASKTELDSFYAKCEATVGTGADLSSTLINTRSTEYKIVGPIDITETPTSAWDTTASASPYIFNVSIRSNYGLGGAFMDGSKVEGLKSMVCANFTGVSLQKDMSCWQVYSSGAWANLVNNSAGYETYINTSPNDVRMDPDRLSRHISAINDAVIQEVSVFAIGHGIHHFTDLGGEVTITNSNSSFGGCSALSKGYKNFAFPQDENWTVANINVPLNLGEKTNNIRRIFLGVVASVTTNQITLENGLEVTSESTTTPAILYKDDYSLKSGTRIWVENPVGDDWQTSLTASAWSEGTPKEINVSGALTESDTGTPVSNNPETGVSLAVGKRVYVRRLADTRTPGERRVSLQLANTSDARIPEQNFVIQTDPARAGGDISRELTKAGIETLIVGIAGKGSATGVATAAEITLSRAAPNVNYIAGDYYRVGTVVKHNNKHYQALKTQTASGSNPDSDSWGEIYVHMSDDYRAEDDRRSAAPILVLDTDTSSDANSTTLGINWTTEWTTNTEVRTQYESATDYQGVSAFLKALGFSTGDTRSSLVPRAEDDRELDPNSQLTGTPSGGAATGLGNWAVEFRRPSVLRLYGHAWEWTGYLNYSKALPAAQKTLGAQNKFTYYFTNEFGGRVVPQGSNEEGFNVTPRGLENVETGATISIESIDSATIDDFQTTDFPNGLSASSITVGDLTVTGSATFSSSSQGTTEKLGVVQLADAVSLREGSTITGNNDSELDASISAEPEVVTIKALNYWKKENGLLSAPSSGTQFIYVDPLNGNDVTTVEDALNAPPTTASQAITRLDIAADFVATLFSPSVNVEYRIGPGLYSRKRCTFTTKAKIRAWDYNTVAPDGTKGVYLNDAKLGGSTPFLGENGVTYSNYTDPTKQPTFPTTFEASRVRQNQDSLLIRTIPTRLDFEQEGIVTGVSWLGIVDTMLSTFPDSDYPTRAEYGLAEVPVSEWRTPATNTPDEALNYLFRSFAARNFTTSDTVYLIYGMRQENAITFRAGGTVQNCAFGAMQPCDPSVVGGVANKRSLIGLYSSKEVTADGIRLCGNVKLSGGSNSGTVDAPGGGTYDFGKIRFRQSDIATPATYRFTGHSVSVFSCQNGNTVSRIVLGSRNERSNDGLFFDSNQPWNNWTLLNNSNQVATSDGTASNDGWKTIGPAFNRFVDGLVDRIEPHGKRQFNQTNITNVPGSTVSGGFEGKFGKYNGAYTNNDGDDTKYTRGIGFADYGKFTTYSDEGQNTEFNSFFRKAGSGDIPSLAGYVPSNVGEAGQDDDRTTSVGLWSELNIKLRGYKKGCDVTTGRIIGEDVIF